MFRRIEFNLSFFLIHWKCDEAFHDLINAGAVWVSGFPDST